MQKAISTYVYVKQRLHPGLLDGLVRGGAQAIEIFAARQHLDYANRKQHVREIADWFRTSGVPLNSVHSPMYADYESGRAGGQPRLPGTARSPVPLIGYAPTTYFGRCLALVLRRQGNAAVLQPYGESDMAEVLKQMALASDGIAWLPRSLIEGELASGALTSAGERRWMLDLELRLYRDRNNASPLLAQLWSHLTDLQSGSLN